MLGISVVRAWADRIHRSIGVALVFVLVGGAGLASARSNLRTVRFHGYTVTVPSSWPVYDLARLPHTCVRFNRHALYLGVPGTTQRCPAEAVGRTEAILLEPTGAVATRGGSGALAAEPVAGAATAFTVPSAGVAVTATWLHDPGVIASALHVSRVRPAGTGGHAAAPRSAARIAAARLHASSDVYTGRGFDACHTPSSQQMAAWTSASPYRAIGIYIGGANAACPPSRDPNLTTTWINGEIAAGWHLIPTYVGLQAPSNSCGCSAISTNAGQATAQGTAAAEDAATQAQALGLPAGNPIYDDMEYYPRTATNTSAVLAFLGAWTAQLHTEGYQSGVYGNANSAAADLATKYGSGYAEPDDIWFAAWPGDGTQTTNDPNIPSSDWVNHQRIHQYGGAHNETYGGVTINIDGDYVDAATAGTAGPAQLPPPSLAISPTAGGTTTLTARWSGPGLTSWQVLAGTAAGAISPIGTANAPGATTKIAVRSAASYFAIQALGSSGQSLARSATVATPRYLTLYGRSVFVNASSGVGGVPAGCYVVTACHIVTTVSVGRTVIARTGTESLGAERTGIVFFRLTAPGRRLLAHAPRARLAVRVAVRDASGTTAVSAMTLTPFSTSGKAPPHSLTPSPLMRPVGFTDFVFARGQGGILTACDSAAPCLISATLSVGRTTIASTRPELVGGLELGYVQFAITSQGRALLNRNSGNHLGASLVLRCGSAVSRARIALVQFT